MLAAKWSLGWIYLLIGAQTSLASNLYEEDYGVYGAAPLSQEALLKLYVQQLLRRQVEPHFQQPVSQGLVDEDRSPELNHRSVERRPVVTNKLDRAPDDGSEIAAVLSERSQERIAGERQNTVSNHQSDAIVIKRVREVTGLARSERAESNALHSHVNSFVFIGVMVACATLALVGLAAAGACWYRLQRSGKGGSSSLNGAISAEAPLPSYNVTGPVPVSGDQKLAASAQMYHYQHQKQQMLAMRDTEKSYESDDHDSAMDDEDERDDDDVASERATADLTYTVYECPGLAPTGQMEVHNPLFSAESVDAAEKAKKKDTE